MKILDIKRHFQLLAIEPVRSKRQCFYYVNLGIFLWIGNVISLGYDYYLSLSHRSLSMEGTLRMYTTIIDRILLLSLISVVIIQNILYKEEILKLEGTLTKIDFEIGYRQPNSCWFTSFFLFLVYLSLTGAFLNKIFQRPVFAIYTPYYISQLQLAGLVVQFIKKAWLAKRKFNKLNNSLKCYLKRKGKRELYLNNFLDVHGLLSSTINKLNNYDDARLLLLSMYLFMRIITTPCVVLNEMNKMEMKVGYVVFSTYWIFLNIGHFLTIIFSSHLASTEAKKAGIILRNHVCEKRLRNAEQVAVCLLRLSYQNIIYSPYGLFELKPSIMISMLHEFLTYFVILVNTSY